jgi:hypothetical protein
MHQAARERFGVNRFESVPTNDPFDVEWISCLASQSATEPTPINMVPCEVIVGC